MDWHYSVNLINAHGIIALAAYNIKEAGLAKVVPEEAMKILEDGYRQSMMRNIWLTERWKEVNSILSKAGIKHVLLKGMDLEHTLYGSKGLRQMTDNDILVKRDDALRAWNLLLDSGFTAKPLKSPLHRKIMLDIGKHLPSLYKNGYVVEIHHKLFDSDEENGFGDPVDKAVEVSVGNTMAWILPGEIQIQYLTEHLQRHTIEGSWQFRQYADIKLLDRTAKIEIPESFITEPFQDKKSIFIKTSYRLAISSISKKKRLRYLAGDIFPSLEWMKWRHKCNGVKALLFYPQRIGKLAWLI